MNASPRLARIKSNMQLEERAHRRRGVRRILEWPWAYATLQALVQPLAARQRFVAEFIPARPGSRILDIGCGTGSILDHFPREVHYVGYDLNPKYIANARERYASRAHFFEADVMCSAAPNIEGEKFDLVLALGLLHHLVDAEARCVCASAHAHLKDGGMFITFDPVYVSQQSRIARFVISRDRGQGVRTPEGYLALVEPMFETVKRQVRTDLLRIPYTHYVMHCIK